MFRHKFRDVKAMPQKAERVTRVRKGFVNERDSCDVFGQFYYSLSAERESLVSEKLALLCCSIVF
jgi:hypothetical protein